MGGKKKKKWLAAGWSEVFRCCVSLQRHLRNTNRSQMAAKKKIVKNFFFNVFFFFPRWDKNFKKRIIEFAQNSPKCPIIVSRLTAVANVCLCHRGHAALSDRRRLPFSAVHRQKKESDATRPDCGGRAPAAEGRSIINRERYPIFMAVLRTQRRRRSTTPVSPRWRRGDACYPLEQKAPVPCSLKAAAAVT